MTKRSFEQACAEQNAQRAQEVAMARQTGAPCSMVDMFAFGTTYCTTHRVMGACPFAQAVQS